MGTARMLGKEAGPAEAVPGSAAEALVGRMTPEWLTRRISTDANQNPRVRSSASKSAEQA